MSTPLPDIELVAFNTATASENKIHDDEVAGKLGFGGGLVPGVDVYAYLVRPALNHWGAAFHTGGEVEVRLDAPVYDGETVVVRSAVDDAGVLTATVWSRDAACATLVGRLADGHPTPPEVGEAPVPALDDRPPADPEQVVEGRILGTVISTLDDEGSRIYLDEVRDPDSPVVADRLVHPGWLLRHANHSLSHTVLLGPWIHVGSVVRHHRPLPLGSELRTRGRITRAFERKGHRFVNLDVVLIDGTASAAGRGPDPVVVATVEHTAIVEPRQVRTDH